uniref:Uncharacterized protein n=1 Tax=Mycena chlorophos TaxID=658473 RepID=A0ABQ0L6T1_MYCCL|nr:predicted protein [Mycena chlorophos]
MCVWAIYRSRRLVVRNRIGNDVDVDRFWLRSTTTTTVAPPMASESVSETFDVALMNTHCVVPARTIAPDLGGSALFARLQRSDSDNPPSRRLAWPLQKIIAAQSTVRLCRQTFFCTTFLSGPAKPASHVSSTGRRCNRRAPCLSRGIPWHACTFLDKISPTWPSAVQRIRQTEIDLADESRRLRAASPAPSTTRLATIFSTHPTCVLRQPTSCMSSPHTRGLSRLQNLIHVVHALLGRIRR